MTTVAYATPASPKSAIMDPVANAEAVMFTTLLPSRIAPISRPFLWCRRLTIRARRLPLLSIWCMRGREAAVNAVSEPEKNADKIRRTPMALRETSMGLLSEL